MQPTFVLEKSKCTQHNVKLYNGLLHSSFSLCKYSMKTILNMRTFLRNKKNSQNESKVMPGSKHLCQELGWPGTKTKLSNCTDWKPINLWNIDLEMVKNQTLFRALVMFFWLISDVNSSDLQHWQKSFILISE